MGGVSRCYSIGVRRGAPLPTARRSKTDDRRVAPREGSRECVETKFSVGIFSAFPDAECAKESPH